MSDGGGVGQGSTVETASEHIRNALAILYHCPHYITLRDVRAVEARLRRALEQLERGSV
jgi:hypothetical protein